MPHPGRKRWWRPRQVCLLWWYDTETGRTLRYCIGRAVERTTLSWLLNRAHCTGAVCTGTASGPTSGPGSGRCSWSSRGGACCDDPVNCLAREGPATAPSATPTAGGATPRSGLLTARVSSVSSWAVLWPVYHCSVRTDSAQQNEWFNIFGTQKVDKILL